MTRKIRNVVCAALIAAIAILTLAACDDFFSTSWGESRGYDQSKIHLTMDNLQVWKEKSLGNPDLAAALVKKIISELDGKSGAEKATLQSFGIEMAIEQSGIGTLIIELAGKDISNIKDADGLKNLLGAVQGKFTGGGDSAAANIAAIAAKSDLTGTNDGETPKFPTDDQYTAQASASDIGMAVVALTLAVLPDIKATDDLDDVLKSKTSLGFNDDKRVTVKDGAKPEEKALAAYLNLIAEDMTGKYEKNPITSGLMSAFKL